MTGELRDLLVVVPDEERCSPAVPDDDAIAGILRARETPRSDRHRSRGAVRLRVAVLRAGVRGPGGPVTGSAHPSLAPYRAEHLGRDELVGYPESDRGGPGRRPRPPERPRGHGAGRRTARLCPGFEHATAGPSLTDTRRVHSLGRGTRQHVQRPPTAPELGRCLGRPSRQRTSLRTSISARGWLSIITYARQAAAESVTCKGFRASLSNADQSRMESSVLGFEAY